MTSETETLNERYSRAAQRVLDALNRWSDRLEGRTSQKREHPRKEFRSRLWIHLPETEGANGQKIEGETLQVWCRNISCGGVSFIFHRQIIRKEFLIGLPQADGTMWYHSEVTRARPVHEGFWEYGAAFKERVHG